MASPSHRACICVADLAMFVVLLLAWESAGRASQCDKLRPPRRLVPRTKHVMYTSQSTELLQKVLGVSRSIAMG